MKTYLLLFAICFALFSCQQSTENTNHNTDEATLKSSDNPDKEFVQQAAQAGMFEVKAGELAQTRSTSPEVKNLAQMMIDDHGKANEELKNAAQSKNIEVPMTLNEEKQKMYDELAGKSANDFDKAYADMMVKGHKHVIDFFEKEANNGEDADLKSWASGKLPTLQHHLEMTQQVQTSLGKNN